jgi:hypothetical protein
VYGHIKPNIYDNGSKDKHFEHLKMQCVPFIEILKNVCPHQVHKLWVKLKTITKGETNLVHIGTKKMFDPYKMMGCLSN